MNIIKETTALFRRTRATLFAEAKAYEKQQQEIHDLEEFIAENLVRASTTKTRAIPS